MEDIEIQSINDGKDRKTEQKDDLECQPLKNENWKELFDRLDEDNDGRICLKDILAELKNGRPTSVPPNIHLELEKSFCNIDSNNEKNFTYEEFMNMLKKKEGLRYKKILGTYVRYTVAPKAQFDAVDGAFEDEYSCNPPKIGMAVVSLIELAIFLYDWVNYGDQLWKCQFPKNSLARNLIYDPFRRVEVWRYVSYMFVHVGPEHAVVNILIQILLGVPLEMVHGNFRVLCIYFVGVLAGSLGTSLADPTVFLAGASGGVYALMTAHIASILMNWSEMDFAPHQLFVFIGLILVDVGLALHQRYFGPDPTNRIGYAAHFAGAITGLLIGINVLRNLRVKSWEKKIWWFSLVLFMVLMVTAVTINVADPSYFPPEKIYNYTQP